MKSFRHHTYIQSLRLRLSDSGIGPLHGYKNTTYRYALVVKIFGHWRGQLDKRMSRDYCGCFKGPRQRETEGKRIFSLPGHANILYLKTI